jgi:hypothetical protein
MSPSKIIHLHVCLGDEIAILNGGACGRLVKRMILFPDLLMIMSRRLLPLSTNLACFAPRQS